MHERLVKLLIDKNLKLTTAESCTGGLISSKVVEVSNASLVFDMGFVTYSNESKIKELGVNKEIIDTYGVVSEEVVKEMAIGAKCKAKANCAIAVSGIAGPTGGTKEKPIGMVCFGYAYEDYVFTETMYFGDIGRNIVRERTANHAIERMVLILENSNKNT